jgi:transcriptional regulator with XRE-family HTH domain
VSLAAAAVDEVRRRMTDQRLSAREVARRAALPPTSVHRALNGERVLSIDELDAVASVLGVKPEYLLRQARTRIPPAGDVQNRTAVLPQE